MVEREAKPYLNPFMNAFAYVLHWQVLLFVLFMLLLDADMTSSLQGTVISVALLLANLALVLVVFVDTHRSELRKGEADRLQKLQVLAMSKVYAGTGSAPEDRRGTLSLDPSSSLKSLFRSLTVAAPARTRDNGIAGRAEGEGATNCPTADGSGGVVTIELTASPSNAGASVDRGHMGDGDGFILERTASAVVIENPLLQAFNRGRGLSGESTRSQSSSEADAGLGASGGGARAGRSDSAPSVARQASGGSSRGQQPGNSRLPSTAALPESSIQTPQGRERAGNTGSGMI